MTNHANICDPKQTFHFTTEKDTLENEFAVYLPSGE